MAFEQRIRPYIAALEPYQPGKPIEELERELGISGSIKLASNENPLGPSPKAVEAMRAETANVHRYPDGSSYELRRALARRLSVGPEQLVFGTGSDEILELLAKVFLGEGDEVVYAWPSFAMYPIVVQGAGAAGVPVPLDAKFAHDLEAMAAAVTSRTRLVLVCNPNTPTGTSVGAEAFDRFVAGLRDDIVLAVDEAYVEYVRRPDFPDTLGWIAKRPGTLAMRTFSKIYGLAGQRIGYAIADPRLASFLERARHPFNVNRLAEVGALAALDDTPHVEASRQVNADGIAYLTEQLAAMGVPVCPTDANFVMAELGRGVYEALLREGVIVRPLGGFGLADHVRITVGRSDENERLIAALRRVRERSP